MPPRDRPRRLLQDEFTNELLSTIFNEHLGPINCIARSVRLTHLGHEACEYDLKRAWSAVCRLNGNLFALLFVKRDTHRNARERAGAARPGGPQHRRSSARFCHAEPDKSHLKGHTRWKRTRVHGRRAACCFLTCHCHSRAADVCRSGCWSNDGPRHQRGSCADPRRRSSVLKADR